MKNTATRSLVMAGVLLAMVGLALARTDSTKDAKTNPERQVADLLDSVIQPRFQVTNGKDFGISRVAPKIKGHGHMGMLKPENDKEAKILEQVTASGYEYKLGFVHNGFALSRYSGKAVSAKELPSFDRIWKDNKDFIEKALPGLEAAATKVLAKADRLEKGQDVEVESGDWHVFVRPIKAERETCASCHAGVKPSQVMGAMVYLVRASGSGSSGR